MTARLVVNNQGKQTTFWIEYPVVRVGASPTCDLRVDAPGMPDHAMTVEFRNGKYLIHNRSDAPLRVGSEEIAAQSSVPLKQHAEVRWASGLTITLEFDGDPSPVPATGATASALSDRYASDAYADDEVDAESPSDNEEAPTTSGAGAHAKTIAQVGVVIACVLGIVAVIVLKQGTLSVVAGAAKTPRLSEIVALNDPHWSRFIQRVQQAEALRYRGQREAARGLYVRLRHEFERQTPKSQASEAGVALQQFVDNRIWRLKE